MKKNTVVETNEGPWIAASGLVFVAAWVVGFIIAFSAPAATASTAVWTAYYLSHSGVSMSQTYLIDGLTGAALIVFAAGLTGAALIVFAAGLQSALRRFEGESTALSSIIFGAGVAASVSLVQGALGQVLANHIAATGDSGAIRTLLELDQETDTFKLLPLGLLVGATSILALRSGALPQWLNWSGAVLALLLIIAGWSFPLNGAALTIVLDVSLVGLLLWVASVSVVIVGEAES